MRTIIPASIITVLLMACSEEGHEPDNVAANPQNNTATAISSAETSGTETQNQQQIFKDLFYQELGQLNPKWDNVELLDSSNSSYRLAINYKESASLSGYDEVSRDTTSVATTTLKVLLAQGRKPTEEWITVHVHAYQPAGVGETGTALIRKLGRASYDFNSDQIEFDLPK